MVFWTCGGRLGWEGGVGAPVVVVVGVVHQRMVVAVQRRAELASTELHIALRGSIVPKVVLCFS